jgi:E3 ubiquitin-protein ligase FANCL
MTFPREYPNSAPQCFAHLPEDSNFSLHSSWNPKSSTLSDVLKYFGSRLERYQEVWDMLDDIDTHLWVLEPEHPTRAQTMRRVAVVKRVSLIIELSSTFPRLIPTLKFLGSETSIAPFQEKLTSNGSLWYLRTIFLQRKSVDVN